VIESMRRLEAVLSVLYPALVAQLRPPALPADVTDAWGAVGVGELVPEYLDLMAWHDGTRRHYDLIPDVGAFLDSSYAQRLYRDIVEPDAEWLEEEVPGIGQGVPVFAFQNRVTICHPGEGSLWQLDVDGPVQVFDSIATCLHTVADWYEDGSVVIDEDIYPRVVHGDGARAVHRRHNPGSDLPAAFVA
jgi:hypothetical protein